MRTLSARDIRRLRLRNQWLSPRLGTAPAQVVDHMGAVQSQELWSGEWSIGARTTEPSQQDVHRATLDHEILRTWPMRGTIHFVPARDARWMLELASVNAFVGVERRRESLDLTENDALAAIEVLREALADGQPMPRSACIDLLEDAGVMKDRRHAYHLLWFASQHGATCVGPQIGKEQSFVNLDKWVPERSNVERGRALGELAYRYFNSHGPSTRKELSRWTGLPAADVATAIDIALDRLVPVPTKLGKMLISIETAEQLDGSPVDAPEKTRSVLLLSGFDEYVLGYGDRSTMMTPEQMKLVVPGSNGVFRPTVVDDGVVVGTWKRSLKKTRVDITVSAFGSLNKRQSTGLERAAREYGEFLGLESQVIVAQ